jgi:hypothetical protein
MPEREEHLPVMIQPPHILAMLICDGIHRDAGSGKHFLLGCFSNVISQTFPVGHGPMALYMSLTDGHGRVPFKLRFIDAEEEREALFETCGDLLFQDPREVVELSIAISQVVFPAEGEYRFQFFVGNEPLAERRVLAVRIGQAKKETNDAAPGT